jgi:hypothetical protein
MKHLKLFHKKFSLMKRNLKDQIDQFGFDS